MYTMAMYEMPRENVVATFRFIMDQAEFYQALMALLERCLDKQFLSLEYNRYVPYRILEMFFASTQANLFFNELIVARIIKDRPRAIRVFSAYIDGGVSCAEQLQCAQVTGNLSCYENGLEFLLENPKMVGKIGRHLWASYDILYVNFRQFEDRKVLYHKHLMYSEVEVVEGVHTYKPEPVQVADLTTFITICCLCNLCAAHVNHPKEKVINAITPIVREGFYWNLNTVASGIILNNSKYLDLTTEKLVNFVSWTLFGREGQDLMMEQVHQLPEGRRSVFAYDPDSYTRCKSALAFIVTHAQWMDFDRGTYFAILALVSILQDFSDDHAMELIEIAGDCLFDMAHTFHMVKIPTRDVRVTIKKAFMESMLKYGGYQYVHLTKTSEKSGKQDGGRRLRVLSSLYWINGFFGRKPWTIVRRFDRFLYALITPHWKAL